MHIIDNQTSQSMPKNVCLWDFKVGIHRNYLSKKLKFEKIELEKNH